MSGLFRNFAAESSNDDIMTTDNIHRKTFEEILNLDTRSDDYMRMIKTSFRVTFKNFGKIFDYSAMYEKTLPLKAQQLQRYAEETAEKYKCKVSYHAIYSTKGCIDDLWRVREELIKTMYVSPLFWVPLLNIKSYDNKVTRGSYHFRTFAFGFYPYAEKTPVTDISIPEYISIRKDVPYDEKNASKQLRELIAWRENKISAGEDRVWRIRLERDHDSRKKLHSLYYTLSPGYEETADDSIYKTDMTSREYFRRVVEDNDAGCFVLPEYKMMFARTNTETGFDTSIDEITYPKLMNTWNMLRRRIAVSDITIVIMDHYYCYAFGYDDTRLDSDLQHLRFFDTLIPDD